MTFARKPYERPPRAPLVPRAEPARAVVRRAETGTKPVPKTAPVRDNGYLRRVAALSCAHCGKAGPSQAAHADSSGKGMGIKPSDYETMPLCADEPGRIGCHSIIGASGLFTRDQRRALERQYVEKTRAELGV